jgi:hypothetical protein
LRSFLIFSLLLALGLSACSALVVRETPSPTPAPEGAFNPYPPQAGDDKLQRDPLEVSHVSLMTTSSLPVRVGVSFTYALPTVCHQLRVEVGTPDAGNRIDVQIYTVVDPNEVCIMIAPAPVSDTILIGVLPVGTYTIYVNGEKVGEISSLGGDAFSNPDQAVTSPPPGSATEPAVQSQLYDPQPGDETLSRGEVFIDSTSLLVLESYPPQFRLSVSGSLPTPCHQLRAVVSAPDASNGIAVDVYSLMDPTALCAQVLQPFTVSISIPTPPQGKYSVTVNGQMVGEFLW